MDIPSWKENLPPLEARMRGKNRYYNDETGWYEEMPDILEVIKKEYPEHYEEFKKLLDDLKYDPKKKSDSKN